MSIFHRTNSATFIGGSSTPRTLRGRDWGWGHANGVAPSPSEKITGMTSYAWEGLYQEDEEGGKAASKADLQPCSPLNQFLTGLMYGE